MKASFKINNPDQMECTLSLTMTLGAFKLLRQQTSQISYPGFKVSEAISELVQKAEVQLQSDEE